MKIKKRILVLLILFSLTSLIISAAEKGDRTRLNRIFKAVNEFPPGLEGGTGKLSKENIERIMLLYLRQNQTKLGLKADNLKFAKALKTGKFWRAVFTQHLQGIPVHRSRVGLVARENGQIVSLGSNFDPELAVDTQPRIDFDSALAQVLKTMRVTGRPITSAKRLVILPREQGGQEQIHLAWHFRLQALSGAQSIDKQFFVDAHNGKTVWSYNTLVEETIRGHVDGQVWAVNPGVPTVNKLFSGLTVKTVQNPTLTALTDGNGSFSLSSAAGDYEIDCRLEGPYAKVYMNSGNTIDDGQANEAKLIQAAKTGRNYRLNWPSGDESTIFYQINFIHDWYAETLSYGWCYDLDPNQPSRVQMWAYVGCGPGINGMGGHGNVYFGSQGGQLWARSADVVYHEYTHNVLQDIFGDFIGWPDAYTEGYAMDEGFADYFACTVNNDPLQGENVTTSPRNLDNQEKYPGPTAYNYEGHSGSVFISSACWDIRKAIGQKEADPLIFAALNIMAAYARPYTFCTPGTGNFYDSLIMVSNGRFDREINSAFAAHAMLIASDTPDGHPAYGGLDLKTSKETYGDSDKIIFSLQNFAHDPVNLKGSYFKIENEYRNSWKEFYSSEKNFLTIQTLSSQAKKNWEWDRWDNERQNKAVSGNYRIKFFAPQASDEPIKVEFKIILSVNPDMPDGHPAGGGLTLSATQAEFGPGEPAVFTLENWTGKEADLAECYYIIEKRTQERWQEFFTSKKGFIKEPELASGQTKKWQWGHWDNEHQVLGSAGKYRIRFKAPRVTNEMLQAEFQLK